MNEQLRRLGLIHEIAAYQTILDQKGVSYELQDWNSEFWKEASIADLRSIANTLKTLARTPTL